ncbi:MAG: LysE family transporter [Bacteroidota bacterium]
MLTTFFIALFLSFIGSLPFGMINMAVAHTAIQKGVRAGIFLGMGAALVELFQVFIALKFTWLFAEGGVFGQIIQIVSMIVFFVAGIYFFFFAKAAPRNIEIKETVKKRIEFVKGMGISSLNLVVIPYWVFYGTLLMQNDLLEKDDRSVIVFSLGAMTGAFLLLVVYAYLGDKVLRKSELITRWVNKFIGAVLVGFGIYQMVNGQWSMVN